VNESNPLVTYEEASREALRIGARMTLPERIRWLEEAEELGLRLQAWRWKAGQGVDPRLRPLFEARHGPVSRRGRRARRISPWAGWRCFRCRHVRGKTHTAVLPSRPLALLAESGLVTKAGPPAVAQRAEAGATVRPQRPLSAFYFPPCDFRLFHHPFAIGRQSRPSTFDFRLSPSAPPSLPRPELACGEPARPERVEGVEPVEGLLPSPETPRRLVASKPVGDGGSSHERRRVPFPFRFSWHHGCGVMAMIVRIGMRLLPASSSGP
jgi:hypothetical protein